MEKYTHLTETERNLIVVMVNRGKSVRSIARELSRNPGSISREIKRNHGRKRYRAHRAHKRSTERHCNAHKKLKLKTHALRLEIESLIMKGWSPEIVSGRLRKRTDLPPISHEAIYQWIYSEAPHLIGYLVRSHPDRWPKGKSKHSRRSKIVDRTPITERPSYINDRKTSGHWEADLMVGKGRSALQVAVERKTRFTKLKRIPNKTATVSRIALQLILQKMPKHLRQSITYDNGSENVEHTILNGQLGTQSFFCQPYHAWEKATVENTNGIVRRILPKKTNFDTISDKDVQAVESWLNDRPRKCLDFNTPAEAFNAECCT